MLNSVPIILQQQCQLDRNLPVLVGVSGGPDSICLAHQLMQTGYQIVIAHLNHQLRPEASLEAKQVEQLAQGWGIPAIFESANVGNNAQAHHLSIEEAARELRYQFLFRAAIQSGAQAVAVGHNADDQVETVLMHLLRGAGPAGLRGMRWRSLPNPWSHTIPLVRPLLAVWRTDIEAYIHENQLSVLQDSSNTDTTFFRNRLRMQVLPYLQSLNPQIKQALWQTAELVGTDYEFLTSEVEQHWQSVIAWNKSGVIGIKREEFSTLPESLQRELLRHAVSILRPGLRDLDYATVQRTLLFNRASILGGQVDMIAGLNLVVEPGTMWLVEKTAEIPGEEWPQINNNASAILKIPGRYNLSNDWELLVQATNCDDGLHSHAVKNTDLYQAWIDADRVSQPLVLRARQPGDVIQILGLNGQHTKLSDLFINHKIPRRLRAGWPLIAAEETIIWVPGVQLAHPARLTQNTQRVIHFALVRQRPE
jgi:tRNA(Ile)-lysidine synthase